MHHLIRFLLIAGLTQTAALAAPPPPVAFIQRLQAGEKITIVTMGTSLTGGRWRWPDVMLNDWLNKDFPGQVKLINEGVGASASSVGPGNNHALSGIGKLPSVLAHQPDVVFIEFSINDAYLPYKITLDDSKRNLNTLIDRIIAANPKAEIILQTMNPVKNKPEQGADAAATQRPHLADYVDGCRQVAKARALRLVDHYPNWLRLMQDQPAEFDKLVPDGVHPQTPGYRAVLLPELKKSLLPKPTVGQTYLQHPTADGMTVCWLAQTGAVRDACVVLTSPTPSDVPARESVIPNTAFSVWKARLTGLSPGMTYQYQVRYRLEDGFRTTPARHFRTLDPKANSLRAIAFNDTHMGTAAMTALLKHVKPEDFEFSLLLGDILESSKADGADLLEAWNRYVGLLDGSNKPIIYLRGNHDTRGAFAKRLAFLVDLPFLDPTQPWGEDQWQFTLRAGPVSFLALDTGEDDDDGTPATSYKNPGLWQQVRQRQAAWIKQTVAATPRDAPEWRVLLTHMPLYNSPWCSIRSRDLWTPLLREWRPDLALSGHDHQWRATQPPGQGDPWPTLVGGGPAPGPGEEATLIMLTADTKGLTARLLGAKDGRQLTEFVAGKPRDEQPTQAQLAQSADDQPIKAYDIDFNWGPGGPNAFAKPGLWADADPAAHVAWYQEIGCNVIQSFCVSCNGYAWYKNGVVPEQPGLKHDFLPEMVRLAHQRKLLVFGYFCAGSNTRWGLTKPALSYGIPSEPHIPYTDEYLAYLDAAIRDAVGKTGMDGFMVDWLRMPTNRTSNGNRWLDCEKNLYTQLMAEPFPERTGSPPHR